MTCKRQGCMLAVMIIGLVPSLAPASADVDAFLRGFSPRRTSSCPIFAAAPISDTVGDCMCPQDKPACFENQRPWCTRADGRRDYQYFRMTCETCSCNPADYTIGSPLSGTTCATEGIPASQRPDVLGRCICPDQLPVCITQVQLTETLGCPLPDGSFDNRQSKATCSNCACRQACPPGSDRPFADSFGDCACPAQQPICYESGTLGCGTSAVGTSRSRSYFRASCGAACKCQAAIGACEPASCATTADCNFDVCRDCDVCLGISRCSGTNLQSVLPDRTLQNCECAASTSCYQKGNIAPGCPVNPVGESATKFRVNCRVCECRSAGSSSIDTGGLVCPSFALHGTPDRYGDCACNLANPECYQDGQRWCLRNDRRNDLGLFSVQCKTCECRPASSNIDRSRTRPCPSFAYHKQSDNHRNCECPPEKPLCIQGSWPQGSTDPLAATRQGPLCNTTHGWVSSTIFSYNCSECYCLEVEGEGSRLRSIAPYELITLGGHEYMKHYMYVDISLVNTMNTVKNWSHVMRAIVNDQEACALGVLAGLIQIDIPAVAICHQIEQEKIIDYRTEGLEDAYAVRLKMDYGVMWKNITQGVNNIINQTEKGVPKPVALLSARETNLMLNFASIFNDVTCKVELDRVYNSSQNTTWENHKDNLLNQQEAEVDTQGLPENRNLTVIEKPAIFAPRIAVSRIVVDSDAYAALAQTGPLQPTVQARRPVKVIVVQAAVDEGIPLWIFGAGAGGVVVVCVGCTLLVLCVIRCRQVSKARKLAKEQSSETSSPRGTPGSPRENSPRASQISPRGGTRSSTPASARRSTARWSMRNSVQTVQSAVLEERSSPRASTAEKNEKRKTRGTIISADGKVWDPKQIKKHGELAGHRSMSVAAKEALQAERDRKDKKRGSLFGRKSGGRSLFSRKSTKKDETGSPPDSPEGSPRSPEESPRSPKGDAARDGDDNDGTRRKKTKEWFRKQREKLMKKKQESQGDDNLMRSSTSSKSKLSRMVAAKRSTVIEKQGSK